MSEKPSRVCVKVDCKCPFSSNYIHYPKNIIGFHRIDSNDPRAEVGSAWTQEGVYCHGYFYSEDCQKQDCDPSGKVLEVIAECVDCSNIDKCSFLK